MPQRVVMNISFNMVQFHMPQRVVMNISFNMVQFQCT